jgi:hypothetical protein
MSTDTAQIEFPWQFQPPHTTRVLTFRAKLRRRKNRFLASAFVADVRHGLRNRFLPGIGALGCFFFGLLVFRGLLVAADMAGVLR